MNCALHGIGRRPFQRRLAASSRQGQRQLVAERRRAGLGWISLFRQASAAAVETTLARAEVLSLPAGAVLLEYGAVNHHVYILLSGQLSVHLDGNAESPAAITLTAGEVIGEMSVIDGAPVSALVRAAAAAQVLQLSRELFWQELMVLPGVASNLMITLTGRMRRANEVALQAQRSALELEHWRKELAIARQLQLTMVPLQQPMFPHCQTLEICGMMEPASHVGGDLFDAFFIDEQRLFFCIGDVSGHGIAAALFMARTIGLLRVLAISVDSPDQLLAALNDRLCVGNDVSLFVTLFCAVLDLSTGTLRYSNGGHCRPLLYSAAGGRLLPVPKGALVGAFPGLSFGLMETVLAADDVLLCYTDGLSEAASASGELYGEERCLAWLAQHADRPLAQVLAELRQSVNQHTGHSVLEDDCSMLALRRRVATTADTT